MVELGTTLELDSLYLPLPAARATLAQDHAAPAAAARGATRPRAAARAGHDGAAPPETAGAAARLPALAADLRRLRRPPS